MAQHESKVPAFPLHGILPKEETKAASFLHEHPQYDGRGVVVAILDTGVDPGAPGLQVTPDGKPKIIDIIDCSGSGDVDTSTVVEKSEDGTIEGLTGRTLRLNPAWVNPSGKWRIGVKRAYELYPNLLKPRVKQERKKDWTLEHRQVESKLQRAYSEWKEKHPKPTTPEELEQQADFEAQVSQLNDFFKSYDDPGPLYDVVVWHNGEVWEAAVDVGEDGDLTSFQAMAPYAVRRDVRTFNSELDNLNFTINVYEEGDVLSINVDSGSHGTHVAGITAAYHPDKPELNGLAPGAQIVSLKIGDSRLGSMETGVAVMRAMIEVVRHKVDLINMSYGEAVAVNRTGRIMSMIEEVVNKHGVIYVGSASNNGPALSTVGAPGGSGTSTIAAGAYLSKSMMLAEYSLRKAFGGTNFTWSSVGPSYDGMQGPTIVAPGGAIASVPNWTLQKSMLMNGTSMAAPNACGSIALVLSALKAQKIAFTPHLIRRAVTATASMLPDIHPLTQGHGLLQVDAAYDYALRFHNLPYISVPLQVTVGGAKQGRGVYLREAKQTKVSRDFKVTVEPKFHEDASSEEKVGYERRFALSTVPAEAASSWVTIPSFFLLVNGGRGFNITVDGSRLPEGLHFAKIVALDVDAPDAGPAFEVPVTLVKPLELEPDKNSISLGCHSYTAGEVQRHFVTPPAGATWMDVVLTDRRPEVAAAYATTADPEAQLKSKDGSLVMVALQTVQLLSHTPFRDAEFEKYVSIGPGQRETFSVAVEAGVTVEIALAQYAIAEGAITLGIDVDFRGVLPQPNDVVLQGGYGFTTVNLSSLVRDEELGVTAKLDKWQQKVAPSSNVIRPLGARDVLPDGRQIYQLILEYKFNCSDSEEVTPRFKLLNGVLYESPFEAQFFMVFDGNKKFLGCGDAWPDSVKCAKGENTLRLSVRHDEISLLQGLTGLLLVLERQLKNSKELTVSDYASREEVMTRKSKGGSRTLYRGFNTAIFLGEPPTDKLPKAAKPGDILIGSVTFEKGGKDQQPKSKRPKGFRLTYVVPPHPENGKTPKASPPDERTEEEKLFEKVRDVKIKHMNSVSEAPTFDKLYTTLTTEYPDHIPLLQGRLEFLDNEKSRAEHLPEVLAAANQVISLIDKQELALHFGVNVDEDDPKAVKRNSELEARRSALVDALARKARAIDDMAAATTATTQATTDTPAPAEDKAAQADTTSTTAAEASAEAGGAAVEGETFADTLAELAKWTSLDQDKYARLVLSREEKKGRWGAVVKLLSKLIGDQSNSSGIGKDELYRRRTAALEKLGWTHLLENDRKWRVIDCPKAYALF